MPSTSGYDLEGRLKLYFPIFFELLGTSSLNWKTIDKVFARKVSQWIAKAGGQEIRVEASFYNIITASIQGNQAATKHLDFIKRLFEELIQRLSEKERKLIVPALSGMLTNIDRKFRNFLGELLVLNNFKRNPKFSLSNVEVPLFRNQPNGVKIDFEFLNSETSNPLLVEVVNVHLTDASNWSDEQVNQLLQQKIQHKLNITGIRESNGFLLVPVFWGAFEELMRIDRFYKQTGVSFENTSEPASYATFTTADGRLLHMFGTITSIVDIYLKSQLSA